MNLDQFRDKLDAEGVETVRLRLRDPNNYTDNYRAAAIQWLGEKDAQRVSANDAFQSSQADAASRAATAAERAATAAERANKHAITANIIAAIAIAVAIGSIVMQLLSQGK